MYFQGYNQKGKYFDDHKGSKGHYGQKGKFGKKSGHKKGGKKGGKKHGHGGYGHGHGHGGYGKHSHLKPVYVEQPQRFREEPSEEENREFFDGSSDPASIRQLRSDHDLMLSRPLVQDGQDVQREGRGFVNSWSSDPKVKPVAEEGSYTSRPYHPFSGFYQN